MQSYLATDIAITRDRLNGTDNSKQGPLGALSSLSETCAAVWKDASEFEPTGNGFFLFEEQTAAWVDGKRKATFATRLLLNHYKHLS